MTRFRGLLAAALAATAIGCAHVPPPSPEAADLPAPPTPARNARDLSWDEAETALGQGAWAEAGRLFGAFADAFPEDSRVPLARLQQAYAALSDPDPARGLEQAESLLARVPADAARGPQKAMRAAISGRRAAQSRAAASDADLASCRQRLEPTADLERDRAASRAQVAKLQQELQRKERSLEDVKRRLLEIQQLAAEMLGLPKPAVAPQPQPAPRQ